LKVPFLCAFIANPGTSFNVLRVEPWLGTVRVDEHGVSGKVSLQLADLDYDKQLVLVGTTDDWATVIELGLGAPGEKTALAWAEDLWGGYERWQVDLDLPCSAVTRFQYAVAYRHGVVNGATEYEFWDNNWGQNYLVERAPAVE
jgi:hypothetical protein